MSTPQENTPDKKDRPQQEQGDTPQKPDHQGDGEKKAETLGDAGNNKMNLASKSDDKKGWKAIA